MEESESLFSMQVQSQMKGRVVKDKNKVSIPSPTFAASMQRVDVSK